ncbi:hypothetical protein HF329_10240 [Chitinophaga oryzae]|uniref:Uncharacterized protein n=1 Tax=Chitinophaga oryzae TaxID=2725414 RepID=A0AAE6ZFH0_9BACT|nr:hypothetical protein [Chitinophaga oryzae]QJB31671.1 hypothetical protein HF329_10240 [Chitinophaga oryzae]
MKYTKMFNPVIAGALALLCALGCKKSTTEAPVRPAAEKSQIDTEAEAIRSFIVKKYQLNDSDVGYDKKNDFFSIYHINVVSYDDALTDYEENKN